MKFRHEYKYYITFTEYINLKQRLTKLMKKDNNSNMYGTYRITSIYFDNFNDKALKEKIDGVNNREKFRIRYYNNNTDVIKSEKKSKINGLCNKQSVRITKDECDLILKGDINWMAKSSRKLLNELYTKMKSQLLKPKTIVDYVREPFVYEYGNVRITLDRDIRTGMYTTKLFDEEIPLVLAGENTILLEVKFDEYLPDIIKDVIQINSRQSTAYSKYASCRIYG